MSGFNWFSLRKLILIHTQRIYIGIQSHFIVLYCVYIYCIWFIGRFIVLVIFTKLQHHLTAFCSSKTFLFSRVHRPQEAKTHALLLLVRALGCAAQRREPTTPFVPRPSYIYTPDSTLSFSEIQNPSRSPTHTIHYARSSRSSRQSNSRAYFV